MNILLRLALVLGVLGSSTGLAQASVVMALELPDLTTRADGVVVGEVVSVKSEWNRTRDRILTRVVVQIAETWKGGFRPTSTVTIVQPGGSVDGISMHVHGLASFEAGERAVLFLRGQNARSLATVGMAQGKRGVRWNPTAQAWWVDPGDRRAAVLKDQQGLLRPAPPDRGMPLDELRRLVKATVER